MLAERVGTWWPSIVYDSHEAYGYAEERVPRSAATPEEVDALDRVLAALLSFDASDRRLVLARAMGFSWRRIMQQRRRRGEGLRHQSLRRLFRECVYRLVSAYVKKAA